MNGVPSDNVPDIVTGTRTFTRVLLRSGAEFSLAANADPRTVLAVTPR